MARTERTSRRCFSWLNGWAWPFLWILLIPAVTVPWHIQLLDLKHQCDMRFGLLGDIYRCSADHVLMSLLPGLLNLMAFLWLLSSGRRTRYAAVVAGCLGTVRLFVPMLFCLTGDRTVELDTLTYTVGVWFLPSWGLWLLSLGAAHVFPFLVKGDPDRRFG